MKKKGVKYSLLIFGILISVFLIGLVIATLTAPTAINITGNVSKFYNNNGTFFINWTAGDTKVTNYSIFIYSNNQMYIVTGNTSLYGYVFSNTTNANYTFTIQAENSTEKINSTNVSMGVDTNAPVISLPVYTNLTSYKNSTNMTLNVSVTDLLAGFNGSTIIYANVNGSNQSIIYANDSTANNLTGWGNSSTLNLTGLVDGPRQMLLYIYDIANNLKVNNSYWIQIDSYPLVVTTDYTNATIKKNTQNVSFNVYLSDTGGLTGSGCIANVNGTNQTFIANATGACNVVANLTNLGDGNQTIYVWANDSGNNWNSTTSYVVDVDTNAPLLTYTCANNGVVSIGGSLTCTCVATDSYSGVNTLTYTANPTTTTEGTYTLTCTSADKAGNSGTKNVSYEVVSSGGASSGGGGGASSATFLITNEQFNQGYSKFINTGDAIKLAFSSSYHTVTLTSVSSNTVTITVSSTPQTATMVVGDTRKFDLNDDKTYDVQVTLNSIDSASKANLTIKSISESITSETTATEQNKEKAASNTANPTPAKKTLEWWWYVLGAVILLILILLIVFASKGKKKK